MFDDFQKSVKSILYERLTSPLSGAIFFSWLVWNWGLIYYVLVGDSTRNIVDRISYIKDNFLDLTYVFWGPFWSTLFLLTIYQIIASGAYYLSLIFLSWKKWLKQYVEKKEVLSLEKSLELRLEIKEREKKYMELDIEKDKKYSQLNVEFLAYKESSVDNTRKLEEALKEKEEAIEKINKERYKNMKQYKNLSGSSNIVAYQMGNDSIKVKFSDGLVYLYTNVSAGNQHIEEMKKLALAGEGLNSYIGRVIKKDYADKWHE